MPTTNQAVRRLERVTSKSPPTIKRQSRAVFTLVRDARGGNKASFTELHARYRGMVHAVLLSRVGPSEADDLLQDTFVTASLRLPDLRDDRSFGPWLQSIARSKATDHLRARRVTVQLPDTLAAPTRRPLEAAEALAALRRLPSNLGEPLIMRLVQGMTGPEIAEATGLTHGSVRVTLHRAMKQLRIELENK